MAVKRVSKGKASKTSRPAGTAKKAAKSPKRAVLAAKKAPKKSKKAFLKSVSSLSSRTSGPTIALPAESVTDANALYEKVKDYAKERGYRLRSGAVRWFRRSTAQIVTDQSDPELALIAYRKVIDEMIIMSKTIPNYAPGGIGERTLFPVLAKLCPLFPIC